MYEDGIDQYLDAKRKAAKRILGRSTKDLPSNGEISEQLHQLAKFQQGDQHEETLFNMRLLAMDTMEQLNEFNPRLIGSVSTGRVRKGSDIDLHMFTDSIELIQHTIEEIGWNYEVKQVFIEKNGRPMEFNHIYLDLEFPVELSIYPVNEIRVRGRSSTDGKAIERLSVVKVRELVLSEHAELWQSYINSNR
ncbi:MAG: nucleotidyltransferase [Kangiellaceae bacterium]|nr:nucleotidyltransferase [Kangiellaceae bacterium]